MTDQQTEAHNDAVINEALGVIDGALAKMMSRELVSTGEVADLLLDVRTLLTTEHEVSGSGSTVETAASEIV
jgi:citrate synthase